MEKNQWKTDRMIGFSAGVEAVKRVCEKADIYKATRQKPPHFVLNMEDADRQHIFTKFVVQAYRQCGVMDFFELDDFIEFTLDGSYGQLEDVFAELEGYAVFTNNFQGIVAMDITKLAEHLNETQVINFFHYVKKSENTVFLFYISMKGMKRNGVNLANKVISEIPNIEYIRMASYTVEEISAITLQMVEDADIIVRKSEKAMITQMIPKKVEACGFSTIKEVRTLARQLILHAEMKEAKAYLDVKKVSEVCGEERVDKENENYAK